MSNKTVKFTEEEQRLAIANIVVSQSVEGFEINESIQEKMISILNGTADARELAKACLEKYASLQPMKYRNENNSIDEVYCYPNGVLKNKLGIMDEDTLSKFEAEITSIN